MYGLLFLSCEPGLNHKNKHKTGGLPGLKSLLLFCQELDLKTKIWSLIQYRPRTFFRSSRQITKRNNCRHIFSETVIILQRGGKHEWKRLYVRLAGTGSGRSFERRLDHVTHRHANISPKLPVPAIRAPWEHFNTNQGMYLPSVLSRSRFCQYENFLWTKPKWKLL